MLYNALFAEGEASYCVFMPHPDESSANRLPRLSAVGAVRINLTEITHLRALVMRAFGGQHTAVSRPATDCPLRNAAYALSLRYTPDFVQPERFSTIKRSTLGRRAAFTRAMPGAPVTSAESNVLH